MINVLKLFKTAHLSKWKVGLLLLFITLQMLGTLYLPTLTANIINEGVVMQDMDYVQTTGVIMLGVAILTGIFSILATYYSAEIATTFSKNIRDRLFKHTQQLSYQDFKHFSGSSLITRATNDIEQLQSTISMFFETMIPAPFVMIVGLILAYIRDGYMALIILITAILFTIVFGWVTLKIFPLFEKTQVGLDKINGIVGQYLSGIRVVRAFNRTKLEKERMDASFVDFANLNIKINRLFAVMMPIVMLVMSLSTVAIMWFGAMRVDSGNMAIGDIMAIIEYAMNILMYLLMAVFSAINLPRAKVCANRILEVLDYRPEITDGGAHLNGHSDVRLEFKNVSFSYRDAESQVLQNINFVCEKGTTTAIIGGTGSGKSTVAKLIPRLLEASGGEIILNGMDVKDVPQEELRSKIGFVPQKAFLFSGTIADNLKHGHPQASLKDMEQAATIAQAESFINELPEKYESNVVQGGKNFSGGQRQRLSIARMIMKKPALYVFDDSFSALDYQTDAALRRSLKEVTKKSVMVVIAQRITSIKEADQIIVLDEGKVVGKGTHRELLENCSAYFEIAKSQLSEEELENELREQ